MHTDPRPSPPGHPASAPRVALVTGAARRLGRAIALALARDGWDVVVHHRDSHDDALATVAAIEALGRRAVALAARLDDEAEVLGLLPRAVAALGPVTCLVNNASRFAYDEAASVGFGSLQAHLLPNLAAPVLLARELHRLLPAAATGVDGADPGAADPGGADPGGTDLGGTNLGGNDAGPAGVVVNLLDQKLYAPNPDFLSYSLSKAALASATTLLAQALAPRVRVVGVAPGLTLPSYLQSDERFEHAHRAFSPLGRSSTPDDVADSVVFAVTNRSLTGSVIVCDGGQHLRPLPRDVSFLE